MSRYLQVVQAVEEIVPETDLFHGNRQRMERVRCVYSVSIGWAATNSNSIAPHLAVRYRCDCGTRWNPHRLDSGEGIDIDDSRDSTTQCLGNGLKQVGDVHDGDAGEDDHKK